MSLSSTPETLEALQAAQVERELSAVKNGVARYRAGVNKAHEQGRIAGTAPAIDLTQKLLDVAADAVQALVDDFSKSNKKIFKARVLTACGLPVAGYLTLQHLLNYSGKPLNSIASKLGHAVETEVNLALAQNNENVGALVKYLLKTKYKGSAPHHVDYAMDVERRRLLGLPQREAGAVGEMAGEDGQTVAFHLTAEDAAGLGQALLNAVVDATSGVCFGDDDENPEGLWQIVSESDVRHGKYTTRNVVYPTKTLIGYLEQGHSLVETVRPVYEPMLCPPKDWTSPWSGGYLTHSIPVIRSAHPVYLKDAHETGALTPLYDALNTLQKTEWRMNEFVARTVAELWDAGANLKCWPHKDDLPLPAKPAGAEGNEEAFKLANPDAWRGWLKKAAAVHRDNESHARIAAVELIDRRVRYAQSHIKAGNPTFWQVWFGDFRGRKYPVPSLITSQGDDFSKAVLEFSRGHRMTREAAKWLAVHVANTWANDKLDKQSFDARVAWVEANTEAIVQAGTHPLDDLWWTQADGGEKPFQFLAACAEWAGWVKYGVYHETHINAGLDGSCNGIQHYAALLRSRADGQLVNLVPVESPADIYSVVAEKMNEKLAQAEDATLRTLAGHIKRKHAKQPTMTYSYSVSFDGIKNQLSGHADLWSNLERNAKREALSGLARVTLDAIRDTVTGAALGMDFLRAVAKESASKGLPLVWTLPDGFVVHQHAKKVALKQVRTVLNGAVKVKKSRIDFARDDLRKLVGLTLSFRPEALKGFMPEQVKEGVSAVKSFLIDNKFFHLQRAEVETLAEQYKAGIFDLDLFVVARLFEKELDVAAGQLDLVKECVLEVIKTAMAKHIVRTETVEEEDEETGEKTTRQVSVTVAEVLPETDVQAQMRGVGPNVIHSLDACHLRMTLSRCAQAGIKDFSMVHDSFGCHVTRLGEMYQVLRETFVELHSGAYLEELAQQMVDKGYIEADNAKGYISEFLQYGDLQLAEVMDSEFFFA